MQVKRTIKKAGKNTIKSTVKLAKKSLASSPRIKNSLKSLALYSLGTPANSAEAYQQWLQIHMPDGIDLYRQREDIKEFSYTPLISIIVPTYNTPEDFFREMVESVLAQTYENWELVLIDDASPDERTREIIKEYATRDTRIVYKFLKKNHHIAGATNEGIRIARGEFISLFDHDDILWPNALYEIAKALNGDKKLNFIYSDEDKIKGETRREHFDPFYKPDWSFDFLRSVNYITHFTTIRKTVLDRFGYEDGNYNGAQDWELFLRITRNIEPSTIRHIDTIIYSWRVHDNSTAKDVGAKPYVTEAQRRALEDDIAARGVDARLDYDKAYSKWSVVYRPIGNPLVSIVIPSKNNYKLLSSCIRSIIDRTEYENYEIVIVDTGSSDKRLLSWYKTIEKDNQNITVTSFVEDKFSYSRSCNYGASIAKGDLLMMLNDDTKIISPSWLTDMTGMAQQDGVGAVGTLLMYPDGKTVQHAGIGVGFGGTAANMFMGFELNGPRTLIQYLMLHYIRNPSAVTAACLMIQKDIFDSVGGFSEKYRINYNDVDLCLKIREKGYRNVYNPNFEIIHFESMSRGLPEDKKHDTEEFKRAQRDFKKEWSRYVENDPMTNKNILRASPNYDVGS